MMIILVKNLMNFQQKKLEETNHVLAILGRNISIATVPYKAIVKNNTNNTKADTPK